MTSRTPLHRLALLIAAGLIATACGSGDETTSDSVPSSDAPASTVADPEFSETESPTEPTDDTDAANASSTGDTTDTDASDQPEGGEIECSPAECGDPDEQLPERDDTDLEPPVTAAPPVVFEPAPDDREFCLALEAFEDDLPDDDDQAALAAQAGLATLVAAAPDELVGDFQTILDYIDRVVAGEVTFDSMQTDPASERAGERISDFIDQRCEGDTPPSTDPVSAPLDPVDPADDPELPNGVVIPVVPFDSPQRETQQPVFGQRSDDGTPAPPVPGFTPAAADAGFCLGLDIIESRPQPTGDFEELIVIEAYLVAIDPLVPDEIADQYSTLMTWLTAVVDNGSFDGMTDPSADPELAAALDTVDTFVDTNCLGY
jgi:hypothetical protein